MAEQESVVVKGRTFEPPGQGAVGARDDPRLPADDPDRARRLHARGSRGGSPRAPPGTASCSTTSSRASCSPSSTSSRSRSARPRARWDRRPKPVLQVVSRLHPEMRRRHKAAAAAIAGKLWRQDLEEWDEVDKPAAIKAHQAIQSVDVAALSDAELADHVDRCAQHVIDNAYLHHKYTMTACVPVGDFLAGAIAWTGAEVGELMGLLRGRSAISRGFAAAELDAAAKALTTSESAQAVLAGAGPAAEILAALADAPGRRRRGDGVPRRRPLAQRRVRRRRPGGRRAARGAGRGVCAPRWRGAGPRLRTTTRR